MVRNGIAAYQQADVNTADPLKLVIMCYDGAISNLRAARDSIVTHDLERKADAFDRASAFIGELNRALDLERGGEIAQNLYALYNYMMRRLMAANIRLEPETVDEVIGLLEELRSAWQELASTPRESLVAAVPVNPAAQPQALMKAEAI